MFVHDCGGRIQSLPESFHFDICVAMHACGPASDWAQIQSLRRGATYIICPCCLGKGSTRSEKELKRNERHFELLPSSDALAAPLSPLANPQTDSTHTQCDLSGDGPHLQRPRSRWGSAALTPETFVQLAANADFNAHTSEPDTAAASDHSNSTMSTDNQSRTRGIADSKCGSKRAAAGLDQCNADDSDCEHDELVQEAPSAPTLAGSASASASSATTASELARAAGLPRYWAACKALLEMDRSAAALEFAAAHGAEAGDAVGADNAYRVALVKMQPPSASVKNDVLLGVTRAQFARLQTAAAAQQAAMCAHDAFFGSPC